MKSRPIPAILTLILALVLMLGGCASGRQSAGSIELTDMLGRTITLDGLPETIVAFLPSDVEILYALGAQDKLIAVGEYCNFPIEVSEKTTVGTGDNTSVEQLVAMQPDLILMGKMAQLAEQTEALEAAGITVYITDAQTIEQTYEIIAALGTLAGKTTQAEQMIADMKDGFAAIGEKAAGQQKKTVYVEISPLPFGLFTCGSDTFIDELLDIVGAENSFGSESGWVPLSEEQVVAANPEVILTTSSADYGLGDPVEEICGRAGWDVLSAVQGNSVTQIDADACTRPGPRLLQAAEEMYAAIYGE